MPIDIQVQLAAPEKHACDLLALCVRENPFTGDPRAKAVDKALKGLVAKCAMEEEFKGRDGQQLLLHTHGKLPARRLLLLGIGREKGGDQRGDRGGDRTGDADLDVLRQAGARAVRAARAAGSRTLGLAFPQLGDLAGISLQARALAEGAHLGAYRFDRYLKEKKPLKLATARVLIDGELAAKLRTPAERAKVQRAVALGATVARATCLARDLVNEPAGRLTPEALAEAAAEVAKRSGLGLEVHGRGGIEKLGMNLLLAVSQGSEQKPQLVKLSWIPPGDAGRTKPLALVGKAITFDSGGLSLKTGQGMEEMKVDMAGAAAVIAAMEVIGELKPPFPVHGFFGACENLPSGSAYKPGDVIAGKNGTTVEVLNTDAEGRLVLADVLAWASEHEPSAIVDLATLTGAVVVALGPWTAGLFSNDEALAGEVQAAASAAGESLWRLPLPPELEELIRSPIADLKNTGGRYGGAITAALFLKRFVGKTPWVHLDIAGPASLEKERGYNPRGGSGAGVRLLVELVRARAEAHEAARAAGPEAGPA
jgi:leucyl aminopeptidase